jgi:hypothetical protein
MGANLTNQQGIILRMLGGNIVTRYIFAKALRPVTVL